MSLCVFQNGENVFSNIWFLNFVHSLVFLCAMVGGLLYNTISVLNYIVLNGKMADELERIRKKQSWLKQGTIPEFAWKD
jgi:hypothetical protein